MEQAGQPVWTPTEYIAWHLRAVMRKYPWKAVGHQQAFDMVDRSVPVVATQLRCDPAALTALVLILQNLLEEQVPLLPFRPIVETFIALHAKGMGRLRILASIRLLPDVRARVPGNTETGCCVTLPASFEEEIKGAIRTIDGVEYLAMEPDDVQQALALVGQQVSVHLDLAAIVVENAGIRRFVRKLVELQFPRLFVISREELLPDREARLVDWTRAGA